MCGLAGFLDPRSGADDLDVLGAMNASIIHRGPDDSGTWYDPATGFALGHRRLSIVDLSSAGRQPMESLSGRFVLAFNGEIYNFKELASQLCVPQTGQHALKSSTDTEVILRAIEEWGIEESARRFVGMFALAIWDRQQRALHLVRDRLGVKPLYFHLGPKGLTFASELKALSPRIRGTVSIDERSLSAFFSTGAVESPRSIYREVKQVPPGKIVSIRTVGERLTIREAAYWSLAEVVRQSRLVSGSSHPDEAIERLDHLLRQSVSQRLVADVPVGAFLSGGVDSSIVCAIAQAISSRPIKTFSVSYSESEYDEGGDARSIAECLGTDHYDFRFGPKEASEFVSDIPSIWDEPFADSSQLPMLFVSKHARSQVSVTMSGDGGDELFGGYNRHVVASKLARALRLPKLFRTIVGSGIHAASTRPIISNPNSIVWRIAGSVRHPTVKSLKLARIASANSFEDAYWRLRRNADAAFVTIPNFSESLETIEDLEPAELMMYWDTTSYLPSDIFPKVDRATMRWSLEGREPLLDHRLLEFAWQLPLNLKIRGGKGKWILRRLLEQYVPPSLFERPKAGFGVPVGRWIRNELREWAEDLLSPRSLADAGIYDMAAIRRAWSLHLSGDQDCTHELWATLMFEQWRKNPPC